MLRPGLTVRYGRGRSLRYGLLVRVVDREQFDAWVPETLGPAS